MAEAKAPMAQMNMRVPPALKADLKARAKAAGMPFGDLVRAALSGEAAHLAAQSEGESMRVDSSFREVDVDALAPSQSAAQESRRSRFDADALEELSKSIAEAGVLEPLLVRPATTLETRVKGDFEIVAGERRWRAAKRAGLRTVPVIVRDLADEEAALVQLTENIQREGLHPLDEAFFFAALRDDHGWSVDAIAERAGRSRSHVFGRIALLGLCAEAQEAISAGEMSTTVGRLLATVPGADLQRKAMDEVWPNATTRQWESFLVTEFRNRLGDDFELDDECKSCPNNGANRRDVGKGWCLDRVCYGKKKKAAAEAEAEAAVAAGLPVVHVGRMPWSRVIDPGSSVGERLLDAAAKKGVELPETVFVSMDGEVRRGIDEWAADEALGDAALSDGEKRVRAAQRKRSVDKDVDRLAFRELRELAAPNTAFALLVEVMFCRSGTTVRRRLGDAWPGISDAAHRDALAFVGGDNEKLALLGIDLAAAWSADFDYGACERVARELGVDVAALRRLARKNKRHRRAA